MRKKVHLQQSWSKAQSQIVNWNVCATGTQEIQSVTWGVWCTLLYPGQYKQIISKRYIGWLAKHLQICSFDSTNWACLLQGWAPTRVHCFHVPWLSNQWTTKRRAPHKKFHENSHRHVRWRPLEWCSESSESPVEATKITYFEGQASFFLSGGLPLFRAEDEQEPCPKPRPKSHPRSSK